MSFEYIIEKDNSSMELSKEQEGLLVKNISSSFTSLNTERMKNLEMASNLANEIFFKNDFKSLTDKTKLIADWTAIYQDACCNHNLIYDVENLVLTAQGLVYRGILNQADYESLYAQRYTSTVTYKGYTCEICLP